MKKILLPIIFLLMTVGGFAQTQQTSPVASLDQQNTSVVNNNIQYLQNGLNSAYGQYNTLNGYFTNGVLSVVHGGTGTSSAVPTHGINTYTVAGTYSWTPATSETIFISGVGPGGNGANGTAGGAGNGGNGGASGSAGSYLTNYPYIVTAGTPYAIVVGTPGTATSFDVVAIPSGTTGGTSSTNTGTLGGSAYIPYVATTNGTAGTLHSGGSGGAGAAGASSPFGAGGAAGAGGPGPSGACSNGGTGAGFGGGGGGGGGASSSVATGCTGAAGSNGLLIFQY